MQREIPPPVPSTFLAVPEAEWLCAHRFCFAIHDRFPVSSDHVLVNTRRVVPTNFDCSAPERAAVMELAGEVKWLLDEPLDPRPDGYNVGFNAGAAAGPSWARPPNRSRANKSTIVSPSTRDLSVPSIEWRREKPIVEMPHETT
jgi:hypothetical protein